MKKVVYTTCIAALLLLVSLLTGCAGQSRPAETAAPAESIPGVWQTASMAYETDGTMFPEYHVRFTDAEIQYGHLKDGAFVFDHADPIASLSETAAGGYKVQATSSNGVQYTYQTCESDADILEYFETWDEALFPEQYRGGASLSRRG